MPDLVLNDEQKEFQELAQDFAAKEMAPQAHACDIKASSPQALLNKASEMGLTYSAVPEAFGGLGLPLIDSCLIAEQLSTACSGIAGAIEASTIAQVVVMECAKESVQETYLSLLTDSGAFAGVDANLFAAGSANLHMQTSNDEIVLSGEIEAIANFSFCKWFLVKATPDAICLVPAETAGIKDLGRVYTLGRKALELNKVSFTNVKLPRDLVLENLTGDDFIRAKSAAFCLMAAGAVGISQCGLTNALQYSKERKTFGKEIGHHQAISFMLADMAKETETARLLMRQAALICESSESASQVFQSAAVANAYAQESAIRIATDAVQIYGGYGYSKEYPVEKLMRDAKTYQVYQGRSTALKAEIGKQLLSGAHV